MFVPTAQSALKKSFLDAAIAKCGGNEEKGRTLYQAYGSNGQVGIQSDKAVYNASHAFYSPDFSDYFTSAVGSVRQNIRENRCAGG